MSDKKSSMFIFITTGHQPVQQHVLHRAQRLCAKTAHESFQCEKALVCLFMRRDPMASASCIWFDQTVSWWHNIDPTSLKRRCVATSPIHELHDMCPHPSCSIAKSVRYVIDRKLSIMTCDDMKSCTGIQRPSARLQLLAHFNKKACSNVNRIVKGVLHAFNPQ